MLISHTVQKYYQKSDVYFFYGISPHITSGSERRCHQERSDHTNSRGSHSVITSCKGKGHPMTGGAIAYLQRSQPRR